MVSKIRLISFFIALAFILQTTRVGCLYAQEEGEDGGGDYVGDGYYEGVYSGDEGSYGGGSDFTIEVDNQADFEALTPGYDDTAFQPNIEINGPASEELNVYHGEEAVTTVAEDAGNRDNSDLGIINQSDAEEPAQEIPPTTESTAASLITQSSVPQSLDISNGVNGEWDNEGDVNDDDFDLNQSEIDLDASYRYNQPPFEPLSKLTPVTPQEEERQEQERQKGIREALEKAFGPSEDKAPITESPGNFDQGSASEELNAPHSEEVEISNTDPSAEYEYGGQAWQREHPTEVAPEVIPHSPVFPEQPIPNENPDGGIPQIAQAPLTVPDVSEGIPEGPSYESFAGMVDGAYVVSIIPRVGDFVRTDADMPAIGELNKSMESLFPEEKLNYIQKHADEYKQAGAISIYGVGSGEITVDKLPPPDTKVNYYQYGIYDADHSYTGTLRGAYVKLPDGLPNASVDIDKVDEHTAWLSSDDKDKLTEGTATENAPGLFSTSEHVVHKFKSGDKIKINGQEATIDKIIHSDILEGGIRGVVLNEGSTFFTTKEIPGADRLKLGDAIPVIPIQTMPLHEGDELYFYARKIKTDPQELPDKNYGNVKGKVESLPTRSNSRFQTDIPVQQGQSGSGIYKKGNHNRAQLIGNLSSGSPTGSSFSLPKEELLKKLIQESSIGKIKDQQ